MGITMCTVKQIATFHNWANYLKFSSTASYSAISMKPKHPTSKPTHTYPNARTHEHIQQIQPHTNSTQRTRTHVRARTRIWNYTQAPTWKNPHIRTLRMGMFGPRQQRVEAAPKPRSLSGHRTLRVKWKKKNWLGVGTIFEKWQSD